MNKSKIIAKIGVAIESIAVMSDSEKDKLLNTIEKIIDNFLIIKKS